MQEFYSICIFIHFPGPDCIFSLLLPDLVYIGAGWLYIPALTSEFKKRNEGMNGSSRTRDTEMELEKRTAG